MRQTSKPERFLCGMQLRDQEYVINGVRYQVSARFSSWKNPANPFLTDRVKRILTSGMVPLQLYAPPATMAEEYVCSTAGEEA